MNNITKKKNQICIAVIIPALNEQESIAKVIAGLLLAAPSVNEGHCELDIIVCDNGSTDLTPQKALEAGARLVYEKKKGYDAACTKALKNVTPQTDIVVFIDADSSDDPSELSQIVSPIIENKVDMVVGSRTSGKAEKGALFWYARIGNQLATFLIYLFWKFPYTDLGPFRAIRKSKLDLLNMQDQNFSWTIQMQIRALKKGLRVSEIPVSYRKRIGKSKISGTIKGTISASFVILKTIFKELFKTNH